MQHVVRRIDTGEWLTKHRTWEADVADARMFATSGAAANSVHQLSPPSEPFRVEVVEIEWRVVKTKSTLLVSPNPGYRYKAIVEKVDSGKRRSTFRLTGDDDVE